MSVPSPPVFSIVVPTRGRPRQLAQCLEALSRLDYPHGRFEVIVAFDGANPEGQRAAAATAGSIDLKSVLIEPAGAPAARNAGIGRAEGELIAFTDDDCLPQPGWLAAWAEAFREHPENALGGLTVNGVAGNPYSIASQALLDAAHSYWNRSSAAPRFFASNNFAIPADGLREIGGFDESFAPIGAEDREICDRWRAGGRTLRHVPGAVVVHMHELTLRSLWRQQLSYGRGAHTYHRLRRRRGLRRLNIPQPGFYAELARQGRAHSAETGALPLAALLLTSQLAHAVGYFAETLSSGRPENSL